MDGQFMRQYAAWNHTLSFQWTFEPHSAICQLSLAARYDYDEWAVPIAHATAAFTRMTTTEGETDLLANGITHAFVANDLTELEGLLLADNCYAGAILNVFFWGHVS